MGIGDFISDLFGSKNKERAAGHEVNSNAYQYGGAPGKADADAGYMRGLSQDAQGRTGPTADYGTANRYDALGYDARGAQGRLADQMADRAMGRVPSIAQMQADRQMGQATREQASAAASARGPAALALAQQNAAGNVANIQSNISNQAQINAAEERRQAEQAAYGAYSGMRGQDLASQQAAAQQAQFNTTMENAQRQRNDAMTLGTLGLEQGVRGMQQTGAMNEQSQRSANAMGAQGINAGVGGQNAAMNQQNAMGAVNMFQNAVGGGLGMLGKAVGGPVAYGRPYLVGEKGPELVVPTEPGHVIPADQTKKLLGRADGGAMTPGASPADVVTSTWGTGSTPEQRDQTWENFLAEARSREAALARSSMPASGGFAVPPVTEPLRRRDQEVVAGVGAKERAGLDVSDEEQRQANMAGHRESAEKKGAATPAEPKKKATPGEVVAGMFERGAKTAADQAARVDVGYHGPSGGYAAPQLLSVMPVTPRMNGGVFGPGMGPAAPSFDVMSGGGVDVLGSLRKHGAYGTRFQSDPTSGMMARALGGPMYPQVTPRAEGGVFVPVYGTEETDRFRQEVTPSGEGRGYFESSHSDDGGSVPAASFSGRSSLSRALAPPEQAPLATRIPVGGKKAKEKSPEELLREAEEMRRQMTAEHEAAMSRGPAVRGLEEGGDLIPADYVAPAGPSPLPLPKPPPIQPAQVVLAVPEGYVAPPGPNPLPQPDHAKLLPKAQKKKQAMITYDMVEGQKRVR